MNVVTVFGVVVAVVAGAITYLAFGYKVKKPSKMPRLLSKEVKGYDKAENEGYPRESINSIDPKEYEISLYDLLKRSSVKYANKKCIGTRPLIEKVKEEKEVNGVKKTWEYLHLGPYEWLTYKQFYDRAVTVGSGLQSLGLKKGDFVGVYEDTRLEWSLVEHGTFSQGFVLTTIYANLGEEAVAFGVNETQMTVIMTNGSLLKNLAGAISSCQSLKYIIYTDEADYAGKEKLEKNGVQIISFAELEKKGAENNAQPNPPNYDDLAVVMYTSGSTGTPKGVQIKHSNLVCCLSSVLTACDYKICDDDVYISFLPLAHVLALVAENCMLNNGVAMGYGNPRSLIDSAVRKCRGDLIELKPTLMAGVPTVFDRIKKGARDKIEKSSPVVKALFNAAYATRKAAINAGYDTPFWNALVFNKFKANLGGRMRIMLSGGAPLSHDTHEFLRTCFGIIVVQGYGLTETCGGGTLLHKDDKGYGRVGAPIPGVQIKLVDAPEMKYTSKTTPPKGEVWIRGANVATLGYYKNEKKTKEDFREGGWFATGDIGEWEDDGVLKIVDRVKNLVKLAHGEYIALESIESKLKNSPYVENICVYASSEQNFAVALAYPSKALEEWAEKNGIPDAGDMEKLCANKKARQEVLKSLIQVGKTANLKGFELPKDVFLSSEEWTPQNDLMTAAMKLKRGPLNEKFKDAIKEMYDSNKQE